VFCPQKWAPEATYSTGAQREGCKSIYHLLPRQSECFGSTLVMEARRFRTKRTQDIHIDFRCIFLHHIYLWITGVRLVDQVQIEWYRSIIWRDVTFCCTTYVIADDLSHSSHIGGKPLICPVLWSNPTCHSCFTLVGLDIDMLAWSSAASSVAAGVTTFLPLLIRKNFRKVDIFFRVSTTIKLNKQYWHLLSRFYNYKIK